MRPKLTWRVRRWFPFGWVEPVAGAFRARHGDAVADVVELARDMLRDHQDEPSMQDVKATLRAVAMAPAAADLKRIDGQTRAMLEREALKRFRTWELGQLQPHELAECATLALVRPAAGAGRPTTTALAVTLVRDLLALMPAKTRPAARDLMLRQALKQCGLGSGARSLKELKARALAGARAEARRATPAPAWDSMLQTLESAPATRPRRSRGRRAG